MAVLFINLLWFLECAIIADAVLSWMVPNKEQFPRSITSQISDPLCAPFRAVIGPDRTGGLDLSPIIAMLALRWMRNKLAGVH